MKNFTQKFIGILALVFAISFTINAQTTLDFSYTGTPQEWVVPCGVTEIQVDVYGASGMTSTSIYGGNALVGKGGRVEASLIVTPGQTLHFYVGGSRHFSGAILASVVTSGGWNGGGNGPEIGCISGAPGGGATDIRIGGTALTDRVIVAGGGGGESNTGDAGGDGGGLVGENGDGGPTSYSNLMSYGAGGSQSEGGLGGYMWYGDGTATYTIASGSTGTLGQGGTGVDCESGGGGGGYYGGGGGADAAGGGGSSYTHPTLCNSVVHTQGVQIGSGKIIISYNIGDVDSCYVDECGIIYGDNSSCSDDCGVPNGDNSSCSDECGVPNGDNSSCTDQCGVINGDNSSCSDECGVPNGSGYYYAYIDTDGDGIGEGEIVESCSNLLLDNNYVSEGGDIEITGCTNPEADNYLPSANTEGFCQYSGCMNSNYAEYNENANTDDGSCSCPVSLELNVADAGCDLTDGSASIYGLDCNFNPEGPWVEYCLMGDGYACLNAMSSQIELYDYPWEFDACFNNNDEYMCGQAANMYPELMEQLLTTSCYSWTDSEGSLLSDQESVSDLSAGTYTFAYSNGECSYSHSFEVGLSCSGCADAAAFNYNENANIDDSSCIAVVTGCMDETAFNFNPDANTIDDSCVPVVMGCIDNAFMEYDEAANTDDGSCDVIKVFGCMDSTPNLMSNYNPLANIDDGSCVSWEDLANTLHGQLDNIVPEDGIGQADIDSAYADGVASVEVPECEEVATQNIPLDLPEGWSMFGYTCMDSLDAVAGFSEIADKIEIVKDEWGLAYITEWGFNGLGSLHFSEGYQIKMIEGVDGFQFCSTIAGGASQEELDAAYDNGVNSVDITSDNAAAYAEGAASVTPEDGITQADVDAVQSQLEAANQTISELQGDPGLNYPPDDDWWYWSDVEECLNGVAYECANAAEYLANYNAPQYNIAYEISSCVNVTEMGWDLFYASQYSCTEAIDYPELLAEFFGADYCTIDSDSDGVCDQEEVVGCQDESAFNFNPLATDSGNCIPKIYGCLYLTACNYNSEANTDDDSCVFPTNNLNCSGNTIQIGDYYQGGIVFQINDDGTGLVAAPEAHVPVGSSTTMGGNGLVNYEDAMEFASSLVEQGYDDWFIPNLSQLQLMLSTIGAEGNIYGFESLWYWSSEIAGPDPDCNNCYSVWTCHPYNNSTFAEFYGDNRAFRTIRSF